jgi:hypothetical protein
MKRVIFRGLDDYFVYDNTMNRDLSDIIYSDILNEKENDEDTLIKVHDYLIQLKQFFDKNDCK